MISVHLTNSEIWFGALVGCSRNCASIGKGDRNMHGIPENQHWESHIEGALGELAFAKGCGFFWGAEIGSYKRPDVMGYQVRTTRGNELIVRECDDNDQTFVMVQGAEGDYRIVGGILAADAKVEKYRRAPGGRQPAYFVPMEDLTKAEWMFGVKHG
jgi:hypothetical protein